MYINRSFVEKKYLRWSMTLTPSTPPFDGSDRDVPTCMVKLSLEHWSNWPDALFHAIND